MHKSTTKFWLSLDTATFSKFFSNTQGYHLGLEFVERNEAYLSYFYFSDEPISKDEFIERIFEGEIQMWNLIRIRNQEISHSPEASPSISNRLINTTDTLIDLAGVILKILSRIPVFKLSTKEVNRILNASNISEKERIDYQSIKVLNINQKNNPIPKIIQKFIQK